MSSDSRKHLIKTKRWVVKFGSAILTNQGCGLRSDLLGAWAQQIDMLRQRGEQVIIVSSGATAEGIARLGWNKRPQALHDLQAAAAVGQMGLLNAWEAAFKPYNVRTAQILLTHNVSSNRSLYLNARNTLRSLLKLNVIPIINENDSVATEELRLGDNDTLAGLVTHLIDADLLVLLTDQDGLYEADPRQQPKAKLITEAMAGDKKLEQYAGKSSELGRGGMLTKLAAATVAGKSGASTVIASGLVDDILLKIANGENCGTLLNRHQETLTARKRWLFGQAKTSGILSLDAGAVKALSQYGKSLLAVGVTKVDGQFKRGEIVSCYDLQGKEIARGLIAYDITETEAIISKTSDQFETLLGYVGSEELIHRDDMIII